MKYQLNTNAAKSADQTFARIDKAGAYFGVFTRAEEVTSKNGAQGIDFSFKSDAGEQADYLTIWTHKATGEEIFGFNILQALMTCCRVKALEPKKGEVEKWDNDSRARVKVEAMLFPDLMNKQIGLLLETEEYLKNNGTIGKNLRIVGCGDKDGFTASEILSKAPEAKQFFARAKSLKDKTLDPHSAPPQQAAQGAQRTADAFDDQDIPF